MIPEIVGIASDSPLLLTMNGSVGASGNNAPDDVRLVQTLLNNIVPTRGGPTARLAVDGKAGPITIGAIRKFQQLNLKALADGRVDARGSTIRLLIESGKSKLSMVGLSPATADDLAATRSLGTFPFARIQRETSPQPVSGSKETRSNLVGGSRSTGFGAPFTPSGWTIENNSFVLDATVKDTGVYIASLEIFQDAAPHIRQRLKIVAGIKTISMKGGPPVGIDIALPNFVGTRGTVIRGLAGFGPIGPASFAGVCGVSTAGVNAPNLGVVGAGLTLFQFQWVPAGPPGLCACFAVMAGVQTGIPGFGLGGGTGICLPI